MADRYLLGSAKILLYGVALTPLVVGPAALFPHVTAKAFFLRALIEAAAVLFCAGVLAGLGGAGGGSGSVAEIRRRFRELLRHPLFLALAVFLGSALVSLFVAASGFHAFWGDAERAEGFFGLFHYFLFLVLAVLLFEEKEWGRFFYVSLGVGGVAVLYAWLQFLGFFGGAAQPASFFGNPAFLSAYLLLLAAAVAVVAGTPGRRALFWGGLAAIVLTVFLAGIRGAIAGLLAGALVLLLRFAAQGAGGVRLFGRVVRVRVLSGVLLGVLLASGIVFWSSRDAGIWQAVPGLRRIAVLGRDDPSVQTRLLALGSSLSAFREKPILGWGIEHYNVAYNAHYNPDYARYEEAWFDRAHNKLAEVAVMQGTVGLLAYLAVFAAAFWALFARNARGGDSLPRTRPYFAAVLLAYFVQNLFLFDTPTSYLALFALFGFLIFRTRGLSGGATLPAFSRARRIAAGSAAALFLAGSLYALYAANLIPYLQSRAYVRAAFAMRGEAMFEAADRFLAPYTFIQPELRFRFLELVGDEPQIVRNPQFAPLVVKAVHAMEEVADREPNYDPRNFILLGRIFNELGKDSPELFATAEHYLREGLRLAPKRQDVYYHLAFALTGQERYGEAIEAARAAVALSPEVGRAHYHLGLELALAGRVHWDEALRELARSEELGFANVAYRSLDVRNVAAVYTEMLYAAILERNKELLLRIAAQFRALDPSYARDMDTIAGLARAGDWEALRDIAGGRGNGR